MGKVTLLCQWDGADEVFRPILAARKVAGRYMVDGQRYVVEADEYAERNPNDHKHYFASLREVYLNLPERLGEPFATVEHFRKHLLIKCGFFDQTTIVAADESNAALIAAAAQRLDDYCIVTVEGCVTTIYTAKSQAVPAMSREDWRASKTAVLDAANAMLTEPHDG